ncbi:uncharacterized protein LOC127730802 [Mytilus californianus]|uniref:uncharacterized protein LOC127730802 n=1 Tax=Mytilus californianus TaxID=6549 RepID=UPI00224809C8|nr:uncharacterized protein LOC127730802 [Mytilus californianus]
MMMNENYVIVGTDDTTNDTTTDNKSINRRCSFCRKHWKPCVIGMIVLAIIFIAIVCIVVVTQPKGQEDFKNSLQSNLKVENTANKCIYNTSGVFVTELKKDPFAYGSVCEIGSKYVNKYCNIGKDESSSHLCEECTDGSKLPSFCFCDKKVHCVNDKELGGRPADDSKKSCNWCAKIFNNQFKVRGYASCSSYSQNQVKSHCNEGYSGVMCSVITQRICFLKELEQHNLQSCNISTFEECFLKSIRSGKYYHCQNFTESNIEERSGNLEACN